MPEFDYFLRVTELPEDAYLVSAIRDGKDILSGPFSLVSGGEVEIVAASGGALLQGVATNAAGKSISDAVVALVPEESLRGRGDLYRAATTDQNGRFVLQGIAPGAYKLFEWMNAEGKAPFRNSEFLKRYESRGTELRFGEEQRLETTISVVDEEL